MKRYEYKFIKCETAEQIHRELELTGLAGWMLVSTVNAGQLILVREKTND